MLSPIAIPRYASEWWLQAPGLVSEIANRRSKPSASACYQFGDGLLDIDSDDTLLLDRLQRIFGECAAEPDSQAIRGVRVKCSVRSIDNPPLSLVTFHEPKPLDSMALALSLFHCIRRRQHSEIQSPVPGWRLISSSASPADLFMATRGGDSLVDRLQEPPWFLFNYIVSTVMSFQRDLLFVHAASVGIHGEGVLLIGPGGAGKTTLSVTLASRGHAFLSDDVASLRTASCEVLPFRQAAKIRPGPCAKVLEGLLRNGAYKSELRDVDGTTRTLVQVGKLFPGSPAVPAPLRRAFFLRGFSNQPVIEPFTPALKDSGLLRKLSSDLTVVLGVSPALRFMKFLLLMELLSKVRCYFLGVGLPEETTDLIERTTGEAWD